MPTETRPDRLGIIFLLENITDEEFGEQLPVIRAARESFERPIDDPILTACLNMLLNTGLPVYVDTAPGEKKRVYPAGTSTQAG